MTITLTEDGVEVEWTSSSVPVEQLDAALNRDAYEQVEADEGRADDPFGRLLLPCVFR
jgi:hypothetical protein